jgi:electron transfer flavoprotein alpha subunit
MLSGGLMAGDVWVWVDCQREEATSVTFEMLDEGQRIAKRLKVRVVALVCGHQTPDLSATLASYGADVVYRIDHPLLAQYTTAAYTSAFATLIKEKNPFIVIIAATANGRDLAPRLAARLSVGLASDCTMVSLTPAGAVEAVRSTHRDQVYETVVLTSSSPFLVTIRPGAIGVGKAVQGRKAQVEEVAVQLDESVQRTRVLKMDKADPATLDIAEAEIIVGGGRGLGSAEDWHLVTDLADALGASVAGTRMAMDEGWIPRERLIGQTGKSVGPQLYVALGISGAREHVLGLGEAKCVVSVNTDPHAPIGRLAHKAVVGDVKEVVPELVRKLRDLKGQASEQGKGPQTQQVGPR